MWSVGRGGRGCGKLGIGYANGGRVLVVGGIELANLGKGGLGDFEQRKLAAARCYGPLSILARSLLV